LTGHSLACLPYHAQKYKKKKCHSQSILSTLLKILVNERYIDEPSIFNSSLKNKETIQQLSALAIDVIKKFHV